MRRLFAGAAGIVSALTLVATAFAQEAPERPWYLFNQIPGEEVKQPLMIIIGVILLVVVLYVPNALRRAGKFPEGL